MRKDYFDEIFKSSKTVIIPGLGSFTKNESDGKISFNPYLKFNDGFLAGFIAKKQGVTIDDAGKSIAESVDKINAALGEKGEALVLGLGVLKKGADGKVSFITDQSGDSKTPVEPKKEIPPVAKAPEKPVVVSPKEEPKKEEPKKEIPPVVKAPEPPKVEAIKPIEDLKKEKLNQPKIENPQSGKEIPPVVPGDMKVTAPILTTLEDASKKDKKQLKEDAARQKEEARELAKKQKEEAAKEKEVAKKAAKAAKPPKEKKERKKRRVPVWFIVFLVLVAGGGTFTALKWDMVKGWLGIDKSHDKTVHENLAKNDEKIDKVEPVVADDSTVIDTTVVEEPVVKEEPVKEKPVKEKPVKEKPVKTVPVVNTPTGNFHVICGNFSSEANANKMVEKLNAEGNQAMNLGNRGGFYMVSAGSFSTMEEANSKRQALSATHPKAYIYNGL